MSFWEAVQQLGAVHAAMFLFALLVAFGFEFINGFHDTSNAVTTVIYTRSLPATPAVIYSGFMNFVGVLVGGTTVAFAIVNLLPVDLLIGNNDGTNQGAALVMVMSLLLAGVIWNLGTWYIGLPVSSSHTLIGSIMGVGMANSIFVNGFSMENIFRGINLAKAGEVLLALMISPFLGFCAAAGLLLVMKKLIREPRLYQPPQGDDRPPGWIRGTLIATCGGVSFAHGSNDGQKGMGLILLVLIGFMPFHYALNMNHPEMADEVRRAAVKIDGILDRHPESVAPKLREDLDTLIVDLDGKKSFEEVPSDKRWEIRQSIFRFRKDLESAKVPDEVKAEMEEHRKAFKGAIEFVPIWVVIGVALALGVGTTIGYKRIVITVAEKIGKTHLTYAQGGAAELVAAGTILLADFAHMPVSTTHVLSGGIAGTMVANKSGLQGATARKILTAWILTLPAAMSISGILYLIGRTFVS